MVEKWRGPPEDSIISPKVETCTKKKKKKTQNAKRGFHPNPNGY